MESSYLKVVWPDPFVALIWQDINFKYGYATVNKSQHFHPENGEIYVESTYCPYGFLKNDYCLTTAGKYFMVCKYFFLTVNMGTDGFYRIL